MKVEFSYLKRQFSEPAEYFRDLRELVDSCEFTLGPFVDRFEKRIANYVGVRHAIGVNTGTDALILCLQSLGVGAGDEVITTPNTFIATVGAIVATGARPVFVDCNERMHIDPEKIASAVTDRTRVILPVHWTGAAADMSAILALAEDVGVDVVEDACPALGASISGRKCGSLGRVNAFSMHPLKLLNVWGDGGLVVTDDDELARHLRLYHNHGLADRDRVEIWGVNRRLQPVQAVVANRLMDRLEEDLGRRIQNARWMNQALSGLEDMVVTPASRSDGRDVVHLYVLRVQRRDKLRRFLEGKGVECKVHYPVPLHLQPAARELGYKVGDFPECERQAGEILTLPLHHLNTQGELEYMAECIIEFYNRA